MQAAAEVRWSGWLVHSCVKRVHLATGLQKVGDHILSAHVVPVLGEVVPTINL